MNPVPVLLKFASGWPGIVAKVNADARQMGLTPYAGNSTYRYSFSGWGTVGWLPPRLACNVKYFAEGGKVIDLGRYTG